MRLNWTFWDNSEVCFCSHFSPFSPIIGSFKKRIPDGPTDLQTHGQTDRLSYRDAWTHLKNGDVGGADIRRVVVMVIGDDDW